MECEHGTITVTSGNGVYDYLITAKPDEGYCLEKDNLIVRKMDNGRLHTTLWTYEVEDNIYGINPSSSVSTIVVTGIFTEVENKK
ncbi:MAG: hypothetical protein MJ182_05205 [Treponema sp.]|nr:hypothetical protein [Treponema sp.]